MSVAQDPHAEEVVYDSEPERIRRRQERKVKEKEKPSNAAGAEGEVIVITDDEINMSRVEDNLSVEDVALTRISEERCISGDPSQPIVADSQDHEGGDCLDISRFAHKSRLHPDQLAYSREIHRTASTPLNQNAETTTAKKKWGNTARHRFAADFTDVELGKMTKCVSCGIKWTTKKSALQKILHLQSCAKKSSLTDTTIRILIREELEDLRRNTNTTTTVPKAPEASQTFLECVLHDNAPKKRSGRPKVLGVIPSITEAKDNNISERTRALLRSSTSSPAEDFDFTMQSQAFWPSKLAQNHTFQAFGMLEPTGLRSAQQDSDSHLVDDISEPVVLPTEIAPSTGRLCECPSPHGSFSELPVRNLNVCYLSDKTNRKTSSCHQFFPPWITGSIRETNLFHGDDTYDLSIQATTPGNDDTYSPLQRDEEVSRHNEIVWGQEQNLSHGNALSGRSRKLLGQSSVVSPMKGRNQESQRQLVDDADDDFRNQLPGGCTENTVREGILNDRHVHLRILRYEPIHMNVFSQIADEPASRGLCQKLRPLLDRLGVNHYGDRGRHVNN